MMSYDIKYLYFYKMHKNKYKKNNTFYQDTYIYIYIYIENIYEIYKFAPLLPWLETLFTKSCIIKTPRKLVPDAKSLNAL